MIPNYTKLEYNSAKSTDLLTCTCYNCNKPFTIVKKMIKYELEHNEGYNKYCSYKCKNEANIKYISVSCLNCNKQYNKKLSQIKKTPNNFCSKSCAATYNNTHKTTGNRRSKLENYLEDKLKINYPDLDFKFNDKIAINSELDIYIPSLKLAFELNGIFHYEPIYGDNKLNQIKNNDNNKFQACINKGIGLCIIDTSQQKYFKEQTSQKYLNIICDVINNSVHNRT